MEKSESIQIRVSPELKAKLQERAKEQKMTLTKLIWLSILASNRELATDIMAEI